jgi:hypothetical protein
VNIIIILIEVYQKLKYYFRKFKKIRTVALRKSNKKIIDFLKFGNRSLFFNIIGKLIETAAAKRLHNATKTYILFLNF